MKKGEITVAQIIGLVLLIVAFAILLFVAYKIYEWSRGEVDRDTCHESIVLRSSFNLGPVEAGKQIPLQCQTEKICISMSGQDCEEFGLSTKKYPITKIEAKTKEEIIAAIANAMYDCNSMLGQGKLDFMPHNFNEERYCLICSRVAFDKEAIEKVQEISYQEIYKHLEKQLTPNNKNYLQEIYPGWSSADDAEKIFNEVKKGTAQGDAQQTTALKDMQFSDWKIYLQAKGGYAILGQMTPKPTWQTWAKIGGAAGAGILAVIGIASLPISGPIGIAIATTAVSLTLKTTAAAGGFIYFYDFPNGEFKYAPPAIVPYNTAALNGLQCTSFETAP